MRERERDNLSAVLVSSDRENKAIRRTVKIVGPSLTCFPHAARLHLNPSCDCTPDTSWNAHVEGKTSGTYPRSTERKPFTAAGVLSLFLMLLHPIPVSQLSNFSFHFDRATSTLDRFRDHLEASLTDNAA